MCDDDVMCVTFFVQVSGNSFCSKFPVSVSDVAYRQRLRSASSHEVSVPCHQLSTYGRRAFAVAGPSVWNSLPKDMWDPDVSEDSNRQSLKTFLFLQY